MYKCNANFSSEPGGWLGHAGGAIYFRKQSGGESVGGASAATQPLSLLVVDKETLKVTGHVTSREAFAHSAISGGGSVLFRYFFIISTFRNTFILLKHHIAGFWEPNLSSYLSSKGWFFWPNP